MAKGAGKGSKRKERRTLETVCKNCSTDIMHWVHYAAAGRSSAGETPALGKMVVDLYKPDWDINRKIFIHDGSVTTVECDVIVVSTDKNTAPKDNDIVHKVAGPELKKTTDKFGVREFGDVLETDGYGLPARRLFHAVTPVSSDSATAAPQLSKCYTNALDRLRSKKYKSIAFPCLGSEMVAMPRKDLANIALSTVRAWMDKHKQEVSSVIFCRSQDDDRDLYDILLHKYFPLQTESSEENATS